MSTQNKESVKPPLPRNLANLHLKMPRGKGMIGRADPSVMYSPVTDLAMNLNELSTCSYTNDTPKRKLSLLDTSIDTPNTVFRPIALERRLDDGFCSPMDSPTLDLLPRKRSPLEMKSAAYRRFQAMPTPLCGLTPSPHVTQVKKDSRLLFDDHHNHSDKTPEKGRCSPLRRKTPDGKKSLFYLDEGSQDSGLGLEKENDFKTPLAPAPRRSRALSDDTNSPAKYSPVKSSPSRHTSSPASLLQFSSSLLKDSPIKLRHSSLTSSFEADDGDDGFLELLDGSQSPGIVPLSGLENLLEAPVLNVKSEEHSTASPLLPCFGAENQKPGGSSRRGLFRSPSLPGSARRLEKTQSFDLHHRRNKRTGPCRDDDTPVQYKRPRNVRDRGTPEKMGHKLQRCHSETEAMIKTALSRSEEQQDLIGDFSKPYCLPLVPGKKQDLKSISPDTLAAVINNEYSHVIEKYIIVDARYPYEYTPGHIQGAKNKYTKNEIYEEFLESKQHRQTCSFKRTVLIFHCEFSSERGPNMSRFLRNKDRDANKDVYPALHYPEVYLLDGGYKEFFAQHKELCTPQVYLPMLHTDHADDLKLFRAKSKSWAGGDKSKKAGRSIFRTASGLRSGLNL